jgi:hypothetical protein
LFRYPPSQPGPRWPRRQSPELVLGLQPKQKRHPLTRHGRCSCCHRGTRTALLCDDFFCQAVHVGLVAALDAAALQGLFQGHSHYTTDIQLRQCFRFPFCALHPVDYRRPTSVISGIVNCPELSAGNHGKVAEFSLPFGPKRSWRVRSSQGQVMRRGARSSQSGNRRARLLRQKQES